MLYTSDIIHQFHFFSNDDDDEIDLTASQTDRLFLFMSINSDDGPRL